MCRSTANVDAPSIRAASSISRGIVRMNCTRMTTLSGIAVAGRNTTMKVRLWKSPVTAASVMMGVPTHYVRLLARDDFNAEVFRHVRLVLGVARSQHLVGQLEPRSQRAVLVVVLVLSF